MAVVSITNNGIHCLNLPRQITRLLVSEVEWRRPLDVLIFLLHEYNNRAESRASNVFAIERKLRRSNGFGPKRIKMVVDALIASDII